MLLLNFAYSIPFNYHSLLAQHSLVGSMFNLEIILLKCAVTLINNFVLVCVEK
jgi:hypothetical protein